MENAICIVSSNHWSTHDYRIHLLGDQVSICNGRYEDLERQELLSCESSLCSLTMSLAQSRLHRSALTKRKSYMKFILFPSRADLRVVDCHHVSGLCRISCPQFLAITLVPKISRLQCTYDWSTYAANVCIWAACKHHSRVHPA